MDSSGDPTISDASVSGENSTIVLSEREKFLSTYHRNQSWSFPDSIIYYISKNPATTKVYEKRIQSCKYFFVQNPLLVASDLNVKYKNNQCIISMNGKNVDLNSLSSKLWITDELFINNYNPIPSNSLSTVLSKIYQSDIKKLFLEYQKIYISDLQYLASKCESINLDGTTVINADDSVVGLEKIIELLPKIKDFYYRFSQNLDGAFVNIITPDYVQKLIQSLHFSNLDNFSLSEIPEIFDIDTFYGYIKKNKKTKIYLNFVSQLSHQYQNRLQTIVNEITETQNHDYQVPFFLFSGDDFSSSNTLFKLFMRI